MRSSGSVMPVVVLLMIVGSAPGAGQLVVDDFSADQSANHSAINSSTTNEVGGLTGVLGGVRTLRLTQGASAGALSGVVSGGTLTMTTDTAGDLEIWWDGVDDDSFTPTGLGAMDLTNGGAFDRFRLQVSSNSLPVDSMRMQIWMNGGDRCEVQFAMPSGPLELPFSSFTNCTGAATPAAAAQAAGAVFFGTVNRPGAWTFVLGSVESTPVELLSLSVD